MASRYLNIIITVIIIIIIFDRQQVCMVVRMQHTNLMTRAESQIVKRLAYINSTCHV